MCCATGEITAAASVAPLTHFVVVLDGHGVHDGYGYGGCAFEDSALTRFVPADMARTLQPIAKHAAVTLVLDCCFAAQQPELTEPAYFMPSSQTHGTPLALVYPAAGAAGSFAYETASVSHTRAVASACGGAALGDVTAERAPNLADFAVTICASGHNQYGYELVLSNAMATVDLAQTRDRLQPILQAAVLLATQRGTVAPTVVITGPMRVCL